MSASCSKTALCFDTSLGGVSVGVFGAQGQKAVRQVETLRDQAAILVPLVNEVLEEAGLAYSDLDVIITTKGPGSFTGLRIGLSAARSFGLALEKPVVGISTLEAVAMQGHGQDPVLAVLETKRKDFYVQAFDVSGKAMTGPLALEADDIRVQIGGGLFFLIGDGCERFQSAMDKGWLSGHVSGSRQMTLIDPENLAKIGIELEAKDYPPEPLYLRGADVSQPKTQPRKLAK